MNTKTSTEKQVIFILGKLYNVSSPGQLASKGEQKDLLADEEMDTESRGTVKWNAFKHF